VKKTKKDNECLSIFALSSVTLFMILYSIATKEVVFFFFGLIGLIISLFWFKKHNSVYLELTTLDVVIFFLNQLSMVVIGMAIFSFFLKEYVLM